MLVVEDQSLIAMDLEERLRGLGARDVGCVPNTLKAERALQEFMPDFAVLDFNPGDHSSAIIADQLLALTVKFIFANGSAIP